MSTVTSVRNAASCCHQKERVGAATRWMATSCVRTAVHAASKTSLPKSPPTAKAPHWTPCTGAECSARERERKPFISFTPSSTAVHTLSLPRHFSSPCWFTAAFSPPELSLSLLLMELQFLMVHQIILLQQWPELQAVWGPLTHIGTAQLTQGHFHCHFEK